MAIFTDLYEKCYTVGNYMDGQKSTSRYILTALAIILVITAFILIALNALKISTPLTSLTGQSTADAYREGFLSARTKYAAMCPLINNDGNIISGTVTAVSGDTLTITQTTFDTEESIDGVGDTRTVKSSAATKVEMTAAKDPAVFQKELAEFKPSPDKVVSPPSPVTVQAANFSDIKVGDIVRVTSDTNLRLAPEITATDITVTRNQ